MKNNNLKIYDYNFFIFFIFLIIILLIKTIYQLDFTDEMQYYLQIKSLIKTGYLFQYDLFLQQIVYILFYPFFYFHKILFGEKGLVLFGRLLMIFISVGVFIYSYREMKKFSIPSLISSSMSLCLTFAITPANLFAPSYNTINLAAWIIASLKFFNWDNQKGFPYLFWTLLITIMFFAHPTSSIVLTLIIIIRLIKEKNYFALYNLLLYGFISIIISLVVLLNFAKPYDYLSSIKFSKGFGSIGHILLNAPNHLKILLVIIFIYIIGNYAYRIINKNEYVRILLIIIIMYLLYLILFINKFCHPFYGYCEIMVMHFAILFVMLYILGMIYLRKNEQLIETKINFKWLVLLFLLMGINFSFTSGNGINQFTFALLMIIPFVFSYSFVDYHNNNIIKNLFKFINLNNFISTGITILFIVHWLSYPYRQEKLWKSKYYLNSVPAFYGIKVSESFYNFVIIVQNITKDFMNKEKVMLVSQYPALYFILNNEPESCMVYMHSIGNTSDSKETFNNCMLSKNPDYIIILNPIENGLSKFINNYIVIKNYKKCYEKSFFELNERFILEVYKKNN